MPSSWRFAGHPVDLGPPKRRLVAAALLVDLRQPLSVDALIDSASAGASLAALPLATVRPLLGGPRPPDAEQLRSRLGSGSVDAPG